MAPHQQRTSTGGCPMMTSTAGAPWPNNQDTKTAGSRGPVLLEDYQLIEKLAHQNRERIPERTVHAKGWGAFGRLKITGDISKFTCAKCLQKGKETPLLARFSTVAGEAGGADLERDLRGFSLKMYTEEGNWDMVGNNTPVFFVRDPSKFPDFIHALKRHPVTHQRSPTALWDFWSLSPEAMHQITILMSDRGLPASLVNMNGYGSHTYSLWNDKGERFWVKFHFKTQQGIKNLTNAEAEQITGRSRDTCGEDLYNRIERGDCPKWSFQIQVMTMAQAEECPFDPFDLTKVWPHKDYPMIEVGEIKLTRNPESYFSDVEQAAFSPNNVVPGIGYSPDRMLQARLFAYADTHRYRLGTHYEQLPVNKPRCPVFHYHRDGPMNVEGGLQSGNPNAYYEPNSFGGAAEKRSAEEPPVPVSGEAKRHDHRESYDDFEQVRELYSKTLSQEERGRLHNNLAGSLVGVPKEIVERAFALLHRIHPDYESGCRKELEGLLSAGEYAPNGMPVTLETPHTVNPAKLQKPTIAEAAAESSTSTSSASSGSSGSHHQEKASSKKKGVLAWCGHNSATAGAPEPSR
eukprot:CAMPEP_0194782386 /NCGR_PEP_ID=MMETSP0323_2-20130528/78660_1 /TAXON_ID=2866 ORGANISM="Crypthecodinium cohnii, Strain Seligo" /NCGR_SAMPLE_ID=MMETSP0323_2 /ASSEMBLY_ACC=CAM_ASM_000346 /LENGTH=574 /DNA_ID=CAMNT_0039721195 /DNA_START=1 /DNA_END=1725 /DNA_ORIENTATION=+